MATDERKYHSAYEKMPHDTQAWTLPPQFTKKSGSSGTHKKSAVKTISPYSWVVTEKVHGANFCFVCDGVTVRAAKRDEFLEPDEDFFGYQTMFAKYSPAIMAMFTSYSLTTSADENVLTKLLVYGEMFGGSRDEDEVEGEGEGKEELKCNPHPCPVQTEIYYCPHIDFYAFDIAVETRDAPQKAYLDYDVAMTMFEEHKLFYAKPLLIGSLAEANGYDVNFTTTIPGRLGLSLMPGSASMAEGVVIKPVKTLYVDKNDGKGTKQRVVFKHKAERFSERVKSMSTTGSKEPTLTATATVDQVVDFLTTFVTTARFTNLISKVGLRATPALLVTRYVQDVLVDAKENKMFAKRWSTLATDKQNAATSKLTDMVTTLVKNQSRVSKSPRK